MSNLFDAYQQMADSLQEAGVSLSGDKTYTEEAADIQSAYEKSQRLAGSDKNDNDSQSTSTIKYYDNDKNESDSLSISNENLSAPLKDSEGKIIGNVDLSDKKVFDLYSNEEGLYEGLKLSFTDKKDSVPIGPFMYEKTPTGKKGLTFKIGKGKAYMDADIDLLKSDAPIAANTGFVLDFAEGGSLPNTKPMQMEMDLILSETKDPVSGNTAPLGATPEEVRDDVPINASPNEFMINAATRRYYGTEFFEELQKSAAEGWKRIRDGEESYFRDDELEVEDDEKGQDKPINMQEGGAVPKPVGGGFGGYGGTGSIFTGFESKTFTNPETGQRIIIYYFNGRPMSRIPAGFREVSQNVVEEQQQVQRERDDDDDPVVTGRDSWRNKNPSDYTLNDYKDYANFYKGKGKNPLKMSNIEKGILSIAGDSMLGRLLGSGGGDALIKKTQEGIVKKAGMVNNSINNILKSGVDNQGNKLTSDGNNTLFQAQYNANLISATADPTGQTKGTPIFDQALYKDDDDDDDNGGFGINVESLLPPSVSSGTSTNITAEEQAAADRIMAGEGTQEDYDKLSGDDKKDDKILCDLIYRYGYLDEDIWRLDEAFGDHVALEDPELLEGYHTWAKPMVAWIEKETFLSNLYLKYWCVPFTRRWANHIAHVMEPENYKPDHVGKLMLAVGVPIPRAIYKLKGRKLKTV
jgi:hypothetical protein